MRKLGWFVKRVLNLFENSRLILLSDRLNLDGLLCIKWFKPLLHGDDIDHAVEAVFRMVQVRKGNSSLQVSLWKAIEQFSVVVLFTVEIYHSVLANLQKYLTFNVCHSRLLQMVP